MSNSTINFECPEQLQAIISESTTRLLETCGIWGQEAKKILSEWVYSLAYPQVPLSYFTHPSAFPTLLLPYCYLNNNPGHREFILDITYSSIAGYYFIRMIDNVMDESDPKCREILPLLAYMHSEFHTQYHKYFAETHPFWQIYKKYWYGTAEASLMDAKSEFIDETVFVTCSSKKVSAALIPLNACSYYQNNSPITPEWEELFQNLSLWHQMYNDLFDWNRDQANNQNTYFLSHCKQSCKTTETLLQYVAREGFDWGCQKLDFWMVNLKQIAKSIHNPVLHDYLMARESSYQKKANEAQGAFRTLHHLLLAAKT